MMKTAKFYHAGCAVCNAAEQTFLSALNPAQYQVESVHLGADTARITEAEAVGVKSVPALVIDGKPFHINFGASIADLKAA
ncbi:MAG: thioredoxin family protein [Cyanobacteria bacterium J06636_16]